MGDISFINLLKYERKFRSPVLLFKILFTVQKGLRKSTSLCFSIRFWGPGRRPTRSNNTVKGLARLRGIPTQQVVGRTFYVKLLKTSTASYCGPAHLLGPSNAQAWSCTSHMYPYSTRETSCRTRSRVPFVT